MLIPSITVVIPSLNQGRFFRECIESIISQAYRKIEIIVIDGGSSDETVSIIKEYDDLIAYWISEPDQGQSNAINKGFKKSSGEVVAWLNSDDYYLPGALEKIAQAFNANPIAPFYFADGLRVNERGDKISKFFSAIVPAFDKKAFTHGLNYILQPSTFINRNALEQVGYINENLHYGMDSDLWMRLSNLGAPQAIQAVISASREYADTKTSSGSFKRVEELRQIAMTHSGLAMTPGVLCYFCDTLNRYVTQNRDTFPESYQADVVQFWQKTAEVLTTLNVGTDGFPTGSSLKIGIDLRQRVSGLSGGASQLVNSVFNKVFFINRNAFEQIGYINDNLHYGMNPGLWMRLSNLCSPQAIQAMISASREYADTKNSSSCFERVEELRQIAMANSGLAMTPGVLCYFFDTLHQYVTQNGDTFPESYQADVMQIWQKTAQVLAAHCMESEGVPASGSLKIGIDLRPLVLGSSGGISQLVKGVLEKAFALYPQLEFLVFCTPFNRSLIGYEGKNVRYFSLSPSLFFAELDQIATEEKADVLFRAYPMEDTLQYPLNKQIILIPDNQHETYPEFFTDEILRMRRAAFSKALGGAGAIGTISEFAGKTLQDYPGTHCKDIFLMEPSLQQVHELGSSGTDLSDSERQLVPEGEFFLFPANLWKHKNHQRLFEAFRLFLGKKDRKIELVLTGHPSGWQELSREFSGLPIRHLGFVRPELLRYLLERASALVFFSLYEGFGMPLLEAFDAGTPVICSNTTSLPEVGGDAVLTCSPTDIEAMAMLMEQILADVNLRTSLIERGKGRLKAYSWENSAHNLIAACMRVSQQKSISEQMGTEHQQPLSLVSLQQPLPLVSIVTPSFNQGRFLRRTIESVLSQNYPNIEYVVIDGGSTDESVEILRSYGDRFYWVSEKDKGQTDAINKGMARVNGEILAYLNSDDILLPGAIETVVRFFQQHPGYELVYGNADYIDEADQFIEVYNTASYSFERLMQDCMVCQPAAFWRKSIAEKIGPFDDQLNFVMDYDYWMRIAKSGSRICLIQDKLACSRLYPETKTLSERSGIFREIFQISRKHAGYVHQSFYQGYWHHLIYEKNYATSRFIGFVPGAYLRLAWIHHKWDHRSGYLKHAVALFRRLTISILNKLRLKSVLLRAIVLGRSFFGSKKKAVGFYADNWLADELIIAPKKHAAGQFLHIAGIATQNTSMTIYAGNKIIKQHQFLAHEYGKVEFPSELVNYEPVKIQFSTLKGNATGRRQVFLLQDTNIFNEQDTW
jgi:glycosyltransferase involved in cell wall biosynthesis